MEQGSASNVTSTTPGTLHDPDPSTMDEFAQTRSPDDLFDDEFTPVAEPIAQSSESPAPRGRSFRGRGRGGRRPPTQTEDPHEVSQENDQADKTVTQAVRGDRSGSGGVKKTKLTEDELAERLQKMALKAQAREEAHRRAEADEASFQEREEVARQKRLQERQNRRVLEGEREKNRLRKLKAVSGREWDAEKNEDDFNSGPGGRGSQYRRGAHGGVVYQQDATNMPGDVGHRGHGGYISRGFRGRGRGRGSGTRTRGGHTGDPDHREDRPADAPIDGDFPTLPSTKIHEDTTTSALSKDTSQSQSSQDLLTPVVEKATWAEQVEASGNTTTG